MIIPKVFHPDAYSDNPRKQIIATVLSGEISIVDGADGAWLRFDCDCLDALPYCKAMCCSLVDTKLTQEEAQSGDYEKVFDIEEDEWVLKKESDGYCVYNCRRTRLCRIQDDKPETCQKFHCTRNADTRGWKLDNGVLRLPGHP